jgi:hypothetical protein
MQNDGSRPSESSKKMDKKAINQLKKAVEFYKKNTETWEAVAQGLKELAGIFTQICQAKPRAAVLKLIPGGQTAEPGNI